MRLLPLSFRLRGAAICAFSSVLREKVAVLRHEMVAAQLADHLISRCSVSIALTVACNSFRDTRRAATMARDASGRRVGLRESTVEDPVGAIRQGPMARKSAFCILTRRPTH